MKAVSVFLNSACYLKSYSGSRICVAFFLILIFKGACDKKTGLTRLAVLVLFCASVLDPYAEMIGCNSLMFDIGFECVKS